MKEELDILVVDDEKSIRTATMLMLENEGHYAEPAENLESGRMMIAGHKYDMVFLDLRLQDQSGLDLLKEIHEKSPSTPVVIFTAYSSVETAIEATQLGAFDYLEKPFTPAKLRAILAKVKKQISTQTEIKELVHKVEDLKTQVIANSPPPRFESDDLAMKKVLETLFRAAKTSASILILGESGTGKSVIARTVHDQSDIANKPFITISCPSLSKELLQSELFGHVKGAFTGAIKDAWGKVHAADGGTLFLDEIGELPIDIQPKLLRLLQEREYERVGENKTRSANVRVIAATNKDLKQCVEDGDFREDLYYRLNVISVEIPSLRERQNDLVQFASDYVRYFSKLIGRQIEGFSADGMHALQSYHWPGNLRELRNAIERATILCQTGELKATDLPHAATTEELISESASSLLGSNITIEELEAAHIRKTLERVDSLQDAAQILGIDKATLYRKRKKLNIE
ncbi:MAG: sigma-54-dependent transcriptional regulator [Akkermansiaceae bacterium]